MARVYEGIIHHQTQVISGLPDDIAFVILARVPREYHSVLKCVSKRWKELVCSEEWITYRRKHNLSETWIYALCRDQFDRICCYVLDPDSSKRCWKLISGLPTCCLKKRGVGFEALGEKVYLLGGCGWLEDATDDAYCYDCSRNSWNKVASLSTARCHFACEVLDGKIYAIGGLNSNSSDPHSWDTFDPRTNRWKTHSDANVVLDVEDSIVLDGKIYVRCGASTATSHDHPVLYEPSSGIWQHTDAEMLLGWQGPAVAVNGTVYALDHSSGKRLMMWQKDERKWVPVGVLSPLCIRPPYRLVAIGKRIFIIGKGLSMMVFNIDKDGKMEEVKVGSPMPRLNPDDEVIGCKCLAL